jgi:hypothetical protein
MAVRPLRDDRYVVETAGGTYVVDAESETCTCPDHAIRGARCKHVRRVAIEIAEGLVPPPGHRTATCAVCGGRVFVPTWERPPVLCATHDHRPGDLVVDRETGKRLVVVAATGRRADEATTDQGRAIADYETNEAYGDHEPVFEAVYLESLGPVVDLGDVADAKRYGFPASRLRPVGDRRVPSPGDGATDQRATP